MVSVCLRTESRKGWETAAFEKHVIISPATLRHDSLRRVRAREQLLLTLKS